MLGVWNFIKFLEKISPEWPLRLGLGLMYIYSGQSLINNPTAWIWAVPYRLRQIIETFVDLEIYLKFQGAVEIIFAAVFLAWFLRPKIIRAVALLSALEFTFILIITFLPFNGINFFTVFRDIGLLGAALGLLIIKKGPN